MKSLLFCMIALLSVTAYGSGTYLYADEASLKNENASLKIRFQDSEKKTVIAWGRKYRKPVAPRAGAKTQNREIMKPVKAETPDDFKTAFFPHLAPDFYDIIVIYHEKMLIVEGITIIPGGTAPETPEPLKSIAESLAIDKGKLGGWEGFFNHKKFERCEYLSPRAGVLLQQMRIGKTHEGGGAILKGTIHSLDVVWVEKALANRLGWQVRNRQQLYRSELPSQNYFKIIYSNKLNGIRIGFRAKELSPLKLLSSQQNN